jgi:uncharacterized protein (TIGR03546 family)
MLRTLAKFLKALNAEGSPAQISLGFMLGMIVGLTPLWSLSNLLILLLVLIFRINLTAFLLAFGFFSGIAYLFDPEMHHLGEALLTAAPLQSLWTELYNNDFWRLTHFNNTLTLGSLTTGVVLALPLYFLSNFVIRRYREHLLAWVRKTKVVQFIKASRFYRIYSTLSDVDLT